MLSNDETWTAVRAAEAKFASDRKAAAFFIEMLRIFNESASNKTAAAFSYNENARRMTRLNAVAFADCAKRHGFSVSI
jgi:hypothetical protein